MNFRLKVRHVTMVCACALMGAISQADREILVRDDMDIAESDARVQADGVATFSERVQIQGNTNPTGGTGVDIGHDGDDGSIISAERDGGGDIADYKGLGLDASLLRFLIQGAEAMKINANGGLEARRAGEFNLEKGGHDFVVYRNEAEDNIAEDEGRNPKEEVFRVNVTLEGEEIENSVEMWGKAESYWRSVLYAGEPRVNEDAVRNASDIYGVPIWRKHQIEEWEKETLGNDEISTGTNRLAFTNEEDELKFGDA
jgi:hypothetical protein